jgi:hypothetical protein
VTVGDQFIGEHGRSELGVRVAIQYGAGGACDLARVPKGTKSVEAVISRAIVPGVQAISIAVSRDESPCVVVFRSDVAVADGVDDVVRVSSLRNLCRFAEPK